MTSEARIFGIGLGRTGTSSLTEALELLGLPSVHYPADRATRALIAGHIRRPRPALHLPLLDDVVAITDSPVCCVYQALDRAYPGSRFILTVRDDESWLRSWSAYLRPSPRRRRTGVKTMLRRIDRLRPARVPDFQQFATLVQEHLYGGWSFDAERLLAARRRYEAGVREHFRGRTELLEFDICNGGGWSRLCAFLGVPEPSAPFPHANALTLRTGALTGRTTAAASVHA